MTSATCAGAMLAAASTACIASSTPRSGAADVVRILAVQRRPPASSATSVKVPPMSTPRRAVLPGSLNPSSPGAEAALATPRHVREACQRRRHLGSGSAWPFPYRPRLGELDAHLVT